MNDNPVTFPAALTAALLATFNLLGIIIDLSDKIMAAGNTVIAAWVLVGSFWIKKQVAPESHVRSVAPWVADELWPPAPPPPPAPPGP